MESIAKQNPITEKPAKSSAGIKQQMVLRRSLSENVFLKHQPHTADERIMLPIVAAILLSLNIETASDAAKPNTPPRIYLAARWFMGGLF